METQLLATGCACGAGPSPSDGERPVSPDKLAVRVQELARDAPCFSEPAHALVVPQGGFEWSGRVAAAAYAALAKWRFLRVVVLVGGGDPGATLSVAPHLGPMQVDEEATKLLDRFPGFARHGLSAWSERALLAQLPFLHAYWPRAQVVPVAVGQLAAGGAQLVGQALRQVLDEYTLVVAARGMTHFESARPAEEIERSVWKGESAFISSLLERDPGAMLSCNEASGLRVCGADALAAMLCALGPGPAGRITSRGSSLLKAHETPAHTAVSYLGALFPGRLPTVPELSTADRTELGRLAESVVRATVHGEEPVWPERLSPRLSQPGGAFVTLSKRAMLKGCMGRLEAESLAQAVVLAARMAAGGDPRFMRVRPEELPELEVEISVLGRFVPLESADDFEPGRHGLLLTDGSNRGLLLPQVATKHQLDREAFLEALAEKAGLPPHGWRGARLERFGVECFSPCPVGG